MPTNKENNERIHAINRFKERFGFEIDINEYNRIRNVISKNLGNKYEDIKILSAEKQTCSRTSFLIRYKETDLFLIYDKTRKTIVTAMPKEFFIKPEILPCSD